MSAGTKMTPYQTARMEAVTVNPCRMCRTQLPAYDNFCRWCGLRQADSGQKIDLGYSAESETRPLARNTGNCLTGSSQLVHIVTESLSARSAIEKAGPGVQRLVCTLMTVPIWLLIVLLSPLDAYAAAKAVAGWWVARGSGGGPEKELKEKRQEDVENYGIGR